MDYSFPSLQGFFSDFYFLFNILLDWENILLECYMYPINIKHSSIENTEKNLQNLITTYSLSMNIEHTLRFLISFHTNDKYIFKSQFY